MNCQDVEEILIEDISCSERDAVQQHLRDCQGCGRFYQQLRTLEELNRSLSQIYEAPEDFEGRIASSVEAQRRSSWSWITSVLAVVVIFGGGLVAFQQTWGDFVPAFEDGHALAGETERQGSPLLLAPEPQRLRHSDQQFYFPTVEVVIAKPDAEALDGEIPSRIEVRDKDLQKDSYLTQVSH